MYNGYVIVGDWNTRFGTTVRDFLTLTGVPSRDSYSYPCSVDDVNTANDNAEILSTICRDQKLLVVYNLNTPVNHFPGKKTCHKNGVWISELDIVPRRQIL